MEPNKMKQKRRKYLYAAALGMTFLLNLSGCSRRFTNYPETAGTVAIVDSTERETVRDENGENPDQPIDLDNLGEQQSAAEMEALAAAEAAEPGVEEPYLDGGELRLLACADIWQNLSCVMKTKEGAVIVVDGGRDVDAPHLIEVIQELGGHVDAWLLTHPHSDHVGAITEILNMDPMPISIGKVYYSFLNKEFLGQEQVSRRDSDLECYDQITEAIAGAVGRVIQKEGESVPNADPLRHGQAPLSSKNHNSKTRTGSPARDSSLKTPHSRLQPIKTYRYRQVGTLQERSCSLLPPKREVCNPVLDPGSQNLISRIL